MFASVLAKFSRPHITRLYALLIVFFVVFSYHAACAAHNTNSAITVVETRFIDDVNSTGTVVLARLMNNDTPQQDAFRVEWQRDTTGWLPTWNLVLTSDLQLLPASETDNISAEQYVLSAANTQPKAGHTYETTLSYSSELSAVSIRVYDTTEQRPILHYTTRATKYTAALQSPSGTTTHYYTPVGAVWSLGTVENNRFTPTYRFNTYKDVYVRLHVPEPLPNGEFSFYLKNNTENMKLITVKPEEQETHIRLPITDAPLGRSVISMKYVQDGVTVFSEEHTVTIGEFHFSLQPIVTDRNKNILHTQFHIQNNAPVDQVVPLNMHVELFQLQWNPERLDFDYVPYEHDVHLEHQYIDLSLERSEVNVTMPLPQLPGNWQLRITPMGLPEETVYIHENVRYFSTYDAADIAADDEYTFVIFPDTQYFSRSHPEVYTRMTDWVTKNAAALNIAAVLHVGDITDNNSPIQWTRAHDSMSLLHDVVPYVLSVGNHDMHATGGVARRGDTLINTYFPVEMAERYSNLAGTYAPGRIENHYALLYVADTQYLIISLEFGPEDEVIAWARDIAHQYRDHKLILLTHSYTSRVGTLSTSPAEYPIADNPDTTVNTSVEIWEHLLHTSPNAFMTISGHTMPELPVVPYRLARRADGNAVFELLFNWQHLPPTGGNGWLGLLTFRKDGTIHVQLYSPYLDEYARTIDANSFVSEMVLHPELGIVERLYQRH